MKKISLVAMYLLILFFFTTSINLVRITTAAATEWDVILTASMGDYSDMSDFGVRSDATEGFDPAYDQVDPPEPPMGVVSYFWHPDNPAMFQKLSRSKIGLFQQMNWTYKVKPVSIDGTLVVSWLAEQVAAIPSEYNVLMLNLEGTTVADMRAVTQYSFAVESDATYTFMIEVESDICVVHLESEEDTGVTRNLGNITFESASYFPPEDVYTEAGTYSAEYFADSGYSFDHWVVTGGVSVCCTALNPTTVTVSGNGTLKAMYYEPPLHATVESCDSTGVRRDVFNLDEIVYVSGSGYAPSTTIILTYDLYVVEDMASWNDTMPIPARATGTSTIVSSDSSGNIPPTPVADAPLNTGKYDIVVDVNGNGIYDKGVDALDENDVEVTAGFSVIPEYLIGTVLGLALLFVTFEALCLSKRWR